MKKEEIIETLSSINHWGNPNIDFGIKRELYTNKIQSFLEGVEKIISILGIRRSGKSYILRQVSSFLSEKYGKENVLYVNFEDVKFAEELNLGLLSKIYKAYKEIVKPKKKPFLLLDEIQEIPAWEKFVRSVHEKREAFVIISGSSSRLLSEEFTTKLAGRDIELEVFPLNFKEFLEFKNIKLKSDLELIVNKEKIHSLLREYLEYGGFPEIVLEDKEEKKIQIARRYFDTILLKDVQKRFRIKESQKLEALCNYYVSNFSNPITFNSVANLLKIPEKTVERFSKYLEISRILFFVERFSPSYKRRYKSARKVYIIDTCFPNLLGLRFSSNIGRMMENCIALNLLAKSRANPRLSVYYFKSNDKEVDFVVKEGLNVKQLIQVTYASSKDEIAKREVTALLKASSLLKCKDMLIITWDYEGEVKLGNKTIKCLPLYKWLLK